MPFSVAQQVGPDWVSPSKTRNYLKGDPMLDWLQCYGYERDDNTGEWKQSNSKFWHGYYPDNHPSNENYLPETDFYVFLGAKGLRFEREVIKLIDKILEANNFSPTKRVAHTKEELTDENLFQQTYNLMGAGEPVIYQPVLWDHELATYGSPDLLVRSDFLNSIIPGSITADDANYSAAEFGTPWHYVVVDLKYTTLKLSASGEIANEQKDYKAQIALYNAALGKLQGYTPLAGYLIGRGWEQGDNRGNSCFDRIGRFSIDQPQFKAPNANWLDIGVKACEWIRRVRRDGHNWTIHSGDVIEEMRPNMSNHEDVPYHRAKVQIAKETGEVSALWEVGFGKRNEFVADYKCNDWKSPTCTADKFGLSKDKTARLERILWINRDPSAPAVWPDHIATDRATWIDPAAVEFFVDFEFCTDLDDDFAKMPEKNGQSLIFMIGCGHIENGEWTFKCFIADRLTPECELSIIEQWQDHMRDVESRILNAEGLTLNAPPLVFHWSHAEETNLLNAYNSAKKRHGDRVREPNFYDFLRKVVKPSKSSDCVVVKGAFGFGLKAIGKALHKQGLIQDSWADGPTDGLGAMVGSWWCYERARKENCAVLDSATESARKLFTEIRAYNEVDCRVLYETINYLRTPALSGADHGSAQDQMQSLGLPSL